MSDYYTYSEIVAKANSIKKGVPKQYKLVENPQWVYYICRAILTPKKNIKKIKIATAPKPSGDYLSRQIMKDDYLDMAKRLVNFVNENEVLPNYVICNHKKVKMQDYVYMFSRILVYYFNHQNSYPSYAEVNSKAFTKPTETGNVVYDYFVKKTGFKPKCLDDVCDWVKKYVTYLFYYDDHKTNKEVIDKKAGNCTDLLQFLTNMADALGYDWEVIHTKCNKSGVGHVYGRFKKKGTSNLFIRDIACIADESRYCIWCQVGNGGTQLAKNPSWFMQNRNR